MKILLFLIACLSAKALVGSEPPPSPRDGANVGEETKKKLREIKLAQELRIDLLLQASEARRQADFEEGVHPPTIPEPKELSPEELQAKEDIDAILAHLNNSHKCNCGNPKINNAQQNSGPKK